MDPKKEIVQHLMEKLSPDLCKWAPESAKELYAGYFLSDESDDDEQPDRKRARGGCAWKPSLSRSYHLKYGGRLNTKGSKDSKGPVARKRKRAPAVQKSSVTASDVDQVLVDRSVVGQVVSTFSHTEDLLEVDQQNVLGPIVPAVQQNVLSPIAPAVQQNMLGRIVPAVQQNVLSPIAPAVQQNMLGRIAPTRLSGSDSRRLAQALTKLDKFDKWIVTALVEVRYVRKVLRSILEH